MPSPFPGMDPYLEDSEIWPGFHHFLAVELAVQLNQRLDPKYYADIEVRAVAEDISVATTHAIYPDTGIFEQVSPATEPASTSVAVEVAIPEAPVHRTVFVPGRTKDRAVRIYVSETGQLVTSIEILSPFNKRRGEGLEEYRRKRARILRAPVHLIEIDLLRGGRRPGREVNEPPLDTDYALLVNRDRDSDRRISEIWPVALNEPLPLLPVPLLDPDPDAVLDLGEAVRTVYSWARYDRRINYRRPVPPPDLRPEMAAWLRQHLPEVGVPALKEG